ncbi:MAG: CRTAC1 family protein [Ferruginibacter sp.]
MSSCQKFILFILPFAIVFFSCSNKNSGNSEMVALLAAVDKAAYNRENMFCPEAKLAFCDTILGNNKTNSRSVGVVHNKGVALLEMGETEKAIAVLEGLLKEINPADISSVKMVRRDLAMAYMLQGERTNCINNHSAQSCIFPIQGNGIHSNKTGSSKAIEIYGLMLNDDPNDLESRWLLNIAYMTLGSYPGSVPAAWLIKGLDADSSSTPVKPFIDIAASMGLNTKNQAGGSIVDDFNNDGYLDIITSSWDLKEGMRYCRNNGNGTFTDVSDSSGLEQLTGGLNMVQTDYNNDGFKDIFITRGGWKASFGQEPNSLLRNNGDGTFTDVTKAAGLLSFHPTQTATWNDFNNDGWLDVFIGNETSKKNEEHPCELYINNKNGTFTNTAVQSNVAIITFAKGVTSGDYDNDGLQDIFISNMDTKKILLKNKGVKDGIVHFEDVTDAAGLGTCHEKSFPTWFWDYDNDGWLDILICSYEFHSSLATYAAAEALHLPLTKNSKQYLFRNKQDGTFEDVTDKVGLNKIAFAMGSNFGDIDNDGYPDIFLGTGNPEYQSLVPNKMFKNIGGNAFADITTAARVGSLQKGHGVSFADLDNDGDEDLYMDMGGAYAGDAYENSFFINPGQNTNGWITVQLEGTKSNRAAIGARVKVVFKENGITRAVYKDVNSGGSFGSNPLAQHIGVGQAATVESLEIKWPADGTVQTFKNIKPGDYILIKEGSNTFTRRSLNKVDFTVIKQGVINCPPPVKH